MANLTQSYSSGASVSQGATNGSAATAASNAQAATANAYAYSMWQKQAEYNAQQAAIQRAWQEKMANTVYQRSVEDMKAAGINPVLAAGMGLGTASVGTGATASTNQAASYMANAYPDSYNSSKSYQNSEAGLMTFLTTLGTAIQGMVDNMSSSKQIELSLSGLKDILDPSSGRNDSGATYYKNNSTFMDKVSDTFYNIFNKDKTRETMNGKVYTHDKTTGKTTVKNK